VTANPTLLTAVSDVAAKAVIIRRIHWSTSSDSTVIIRRKPRSRSVGIRSLLLPTAISAFSPPQIDKVNNSVQRCAHRRSERNKQGELPA
jgi:hypothetical protein